MTTKGELIKLAIKHLNSNKIQSIKKQICEQFKDKNQQKDCITAFDKSFIKGFISSYRKTHK
jgi:hypothetical protein